MTYFVSQKDLEARAKQLEEEESEIADERVRFEAERAADFYDELSMDLVSAYYFFGLVMALRYWPKQFAKEAPSIMQTFLSHGDACTQLEAEALQLATQGAAEPDEDAPLQVYNEMLDNLGTALEFSGVSLPNVMISTRNPTFRGNGTRIIYSTNHVRTAR